MKKNLNDRSEKKEAIDNSSRKQAWTQGRR